MFHIPMRRRRLLLMILLCETALLMLTYPPEYLTPVYFQPRAARRPVPVAMPEEGIHLLEKFDFESSSDLSVWEEKAFNGKTGYAVMREEGKSFLRGTSQRSCSGLYRSVKVDVTPDLFIEWSWRAKTFPAKAVPTKFGDRKQDDFAARIYLVFPGSSFFKSDVIEYLWDQNAPAGTVVTSPYSDRIRMLVVDSGDPEGDGWTLHRRNVMDDCKILFGKVPSKPLGIIAVMSDSDNTQSEAAADFGSIRLYRKTN